MQRYSLDQINRLANLTYLEVAQAFFRSGEDTAFPTSSKPTFADFYVNSEGKLTACYELMGENCEGTVFVTLNNDNDLPEGSY